MLFFIIVLLAKIIHEHSEGNMNDKIWSSMHQKNSRPTNDDTVYDRYLFFIIHILCD